MIFTAGGNSGLPEIITGIKFSLIALNNELQINRLKPAKPDLNRSNLTEWRPSCVQVSNFVRAGIQTLNDVMPCLRTPFRSYILAISSENLHSTKCLWTAIDIDSSGYRPFNISQPARTSEQDENKGKYQNW